MEDDNLTFASELDRLESIERTVKEHSAHNEIDVQRIVVSAMESYWKPRIEESSSQDLFERVTATLLRKTASDLGTPLADIGNGLVAVLMPAFAYLLILYFLIGQRGDWDTPVPRWVIILAVMFPGAAAIALVFVSIPSSEHKRYPIGVLRDSVAAFMTRVPIGAAIAGLVLTGVTSWALIYKLNAQRETRAVSFNSAKTVLVDKSLSTMKDLQASPNSRVIFTSQQVISLSPNNVFSIKTTNVPQSKKVKYTIIKDQGTFPGELSADVSEGVGSVSWTEDGKTGVVQTLLYVCKVRDVSGNKVTVEAIGRNPNEGNGVAGNAHQLQGGAPANSGAAFITLLVYGRTIELTFDPKLINTSELSRGQNLVVAYDAETLIASRIEPIISQLTSNR